MILAKSLFQPLPCLIESLEPEGRLGQRYLDPVFLTRLPVTSL